MMNQTKKMTETDLELVTNFLSKYDILSIDNVKKIFNIVNIKSDISDISYEQKYFFNIKDDILVADVLELATSLRVRCYFFYITKISKIVNPKIDDNFISKTLYKICLNSKVYKESIQCTLVVWSKINNHFENISKLKTGEFSKTNNQHTGKSIFNAGGKIRKVFLKPLETNAEKHTKSYLFNKYHAQTWVVTELNKPIRVHLFNMDETADHVRTFYSREFKINHSDVRCKRLKNYIK